LPQRAEIRAHASHTDIMASKRRPSFKASASKRRPRGGEQMLTVRFSVNDVKCCCCLEVIKNGIKICKNGHTVCLDCLIKMVSHDMSSCSLCRCSLLVSNVSQQCEMLFDAIDKSARRRISTKQNRRPPLQPLQLHHQNITVNDIVERIGYSIASKMRKDRKYHLQLKDGLTAFGRREQLASLVNVMRDSGSTAVRRFADVRPSRHSPFFSVVVCSPRSGTHTHTTREPTRAPMLPPPHPPHPGVLRQPAEPPAPDQAVRAAS
jgi:hypothetical protein